MKLPCPLSLQNATRTIAVTHGFLVILITGYTMYSLGRLINAKEVTHVHKAKGLVTTINEYFEKYDLAKPPPKKRERIAEITLGTKGTDIVQEMNSKSFYYSASYVSDQKVQQEIVVLTLALTLMFVVLMMDVELFQGAHEKIYGKVQVWYKTVVILSIAGITFGIPVIISALDYDFTWKFYTIVVVKLITLVYVLSVVKAFKAQLKAESEKGKKSKLAKKFE